MNWDNKGHVIRQDLSTLTLPNAVVLPQWKKADNGGTKWLMKCKCSAGTEWWAWAEVIKRTPDICCKPCRNEIVRKARTTHGGRYTKVYGVHKAMRERCKNPDHPAFKDYGGRGIRVCLGFEDFAFFRDVMGERPPKMAIDRINNEGHYSCGQCEECKTNGWPLNCKWSTQKEEMNNRRCNVLLTAFGKTQTVSMWSEELGINKSTILKRYRKGWPHEKCLSKSDFRC